jgi:hypothetical protein
VELETWVEGIAGEKWREWGIFWGGFARVLEGRQQEVAAARRGRQKKTWKVGSSGFLSPFVPVFSDAFISHFSNFILDEERSFLFESFKLCLFLSLTPSLLLLLLLLPLCHASNIFGA